MASYIYYKGKKYGDGSDQKIKAVSMDWFLENNFQTQEEIDAFIEQYNAGGFVIGQDSSGYILIPSTDDLKIESAIMTDTAANGLIYQEEPEELHILLDNGVQGYYSGMDKAVIVQGLRCIMGYRSSFRGFQYSSNSGWYLPDSGSSNALGNMIAPPRGSQSGVPSSTAPEGLTYKQILDMYAAESVECPCELVSNIQHFIETGEIEKFMYTDFVNYRESAASIPPVLYYNTYIYDGQGSNYRYIYRPYSFDQKNKVFRKDELDKLGASTLAITTATQATVFGLVPCVEKINFTENKDFWQIPDGYTFELVGEDYGVFKNENDERFEATNSFSVFNYVNGTSSQNGLYQLLDTTNYYFKRIGDIKKLSSDFNAIAVIYFLPLLLKRDEQGKYTQIPMMNTTANVIFSSPTINCPLTLEEIAYNQTVINRTEPVNWLELKRNLGIVP